MSELRFHTFGCKVNTYDTGLLQKRMASFGVTTKAPIHILNTCAVTQEATQEAVRTIRRLKSRDPFCTVVVTGCAAQVDTDQFADLKAADLIVANSHKGKLEELLGQYFRGTLKDRVFKSNIFLKKDLEEGGGTEQQHTRSFIKIQDGCNSFCTFCIIPFARGRSRSISIVDLVRRIQDLEAQGVREVVLTGVHIGDYEDETRVQRNRFEDLIEELLLKTKVPRFRLSSLEPIEVSERLLELYGDSRLCPHFHMSIQSANTKVLGEMKRKYGQAEVMRSLQQIAEKVPGAFVGMDVIAGFPQESEDEHRDTLQCLSDLPWTRLHVFPYSVRHGTKADSMQQVPAQDIKRRATELRELSYQRFSTTALQQIGQVKDVLFLKGEAKGGQGLSRDYWPIALVESDLARAADLKNQEAKVRILGYDHRENSRIEGVLFGELC